jgi:hypothetical protein
MTNYRLTLIYELSLYTLYRSSNMLVNILRIHIRWLYNSRDNNGRY